MINSNGSQFLLLDGAADFGASGQTCRWDAGLRAFTLTRQDTPRLPRPTPAAVRTQLASATPLVLDEHGQLGRLSDDRRRLECAVAGDAGGWQVVRAERDPVDGPAADLAAALLDPVDAPAGTRFTDLHLGGSGLLALPWSDGATRHGLTVVSLTRRWQRRCDLDFQPTRAWVDAHDRVWLAGAEGVALARGGPLPQPYTPRLDRFEPHPIEPDPLRRMWTAPPLPPHRGLIGLAADDTRLCLLAEHPDSAADAPRLQIFSRPLDAPPTQGFTTHALPADLPLASDLACMGAGRVLLLIPFEDGTDRGDCALLALPERDGAPAELLGERWPRRSAVAGAVRFVRHRDGQPRTLTPDGPVRLYRLAQARFPTRGRATLSPVLDAGAPDTLWDVLRLDACIPAGCTLGVAVQCGDDRATLADEAWHDQPAPLRLPQASELPFAPGATHALAAHPDHPAGLHEVLLQRRDGAVRELRGRYLRLRLTLTGDGRHSPAVFTMRLWHPRQSWQTRYLPEHFHQAARPTGTGEPEPANGADLRERLLASFEKLLTPLEDRIAASEVLLDPGATPDTHLAWLASFVGADTPRHWPVQRQRRWIASQGALQPRRGTYHGLLGALDLLTDGAVARGQVIPVEHFRLRRTMVTLLGLDLDDARHPLTLGTGLSGNSRVGDSLILSDDHAREFLALFAPEVAQSRGEQAVVERFFDTCARRLTVVLHGPARALTTVVTEALPALVPATVQWAVRASDHPFVLGLSPLLGIDTWLETTPPPTPVVLDQTRLGRGPVLRGPVALAPEHARPIDPNALDAAGDPS